MKRLSEMSATELMHIAQTKLPVAWELQLRYPPYRFVWDYDSGLDVWLRRVEGASIEELLRKGLADIVANHLNGDYTKIGSASEELTVRERLMQAPAFMTLALRTSPLLGAPDYAFLGRPFVGAHIPQHGSMVMLGDDDGINSTTVSRVYLDEHDHTGIELEPVNVLVESSVSSSSYRGPVRWVKDDEEQQRVVGETMAVLRRRGWGSLR